MSAQHMQGQPTKDELAAIAWCVAGFARCFPPPKRDLHSNPAIQESLDKLRKAREGLRKVRALSKVKGGLA